MEKRQHSSIRSIFLALVMSGFFPHAFANLDLTNFGIYPEKKVKNEFTFMEVEAITSMECAARCMLNRKCRSASYNDNSRLCDLSEYRVDMSNTQQSIEPMLTWIVLYRKGCFDGWVQVGETCYKFNGTQMNYLKAEAYCKQNGGIITEPRTNTTNQLLKNYMAETYGLKGFKKVWLGMTFVEDEETNEIGKYVWNSDSSPIIFNDWLEGEPYGSGENKCARIDVKIGRKWKYLGCSHGASTVCEN